MLPKCPIIDGALEHRLCFQDASRSFEGLWPMVAYIKGALDDG